MVVESDRSHTVDTIAERDNSRENRLVHPGSRMSVRGSADNGQSLEEGRVDSERYKVGHPRMLRPTATRSSLNVNSIVNIDVIMRATNQTYEQLTRNLELKGLTLSNLYQLTSSGASLEDILNYLRLADSETTTVSTESIRTIDPLIWEMNQAIERENRRLLVLDRQTYENNTTVNNIDNFSDPIYANGVYPMTGEVSHQQSTAETTSEATDSGYDQYSQEKYDYYMEGLLDEPLRTSGQARIHSFTVQEISLDDEGQSDYDANSMHPHYNPQDQFLTDSSSPSRQPVHSSSNLQTSGVDGWSSAARDQEEELNKGRPLAYTIIAASAIMASLAVFTLFVLLAYSIVKCTKKPTLNNYQVSTKQPVVVAS